MNTTRRESPPEEIDSIMTALAEAGQDHVVRAASALAGSERHEYLAPLAGVPIARLSKEASRPAHDEPTHPLEVAAPAWVPLPPDAATSERMNEARARGEDALRSGRVASLLVAGGLGTRLGWPGPKGTFPIGPVSDRSLFQIFAETHVALGRRYGAAIPWAIQTSGANHQDTIEFFEKSDWFGVSPSNLVFFQQGTLPAFHPDGRIVLDRTGRIVAQPDGHGGVYLALERRGINAWLSERGISDVFYFQVDNPLCTLCDPAFVGLHLECQSQMSTRAVRKEEPSERVGVLARVGGRLRVIEYTELPSDLSAHREDDGGLTLRAGNTGIHAFALDFLRAMAAETSFPVHIARKPVPTGPDETVDGVKFEYFVFDALPYAERTLVMECARETDFAPVKNGTGQDSPDTARAMLSAMYRMWLREWGASVGDDTPVEISPLVALGPEELKLRPTPRALPSGPLILST